MNALHEASLVAVTREDAATLFGVHVVTIDHMCSTNRLGRYVGKFDVYVVLEKDEYDLLKEAAGR